MPWGVFPDGRTGLSSSLDTLLESSSLDPLKSSLLDPLLESSSLSQSVSQSGSPDLFIVLSVFMPLNACGYAFYFRELHKLNKMKAYCGRQFAPMSVHPSAHLCVPCALTDHHAMKAYWEWRYSSIHSLIAALHGGEWSASRPGRFTPRERAPGIHWVGGWVGPGHCGEEKNSQPPSAIEP
jgi:hypothetical protein